MFGSTIRGQIITINVFLKIMYLCQSISHSSIYTNAYIGFITTDIELYYNNIGEKIYLEEGFIRPRWLYRSLLDVRNEARDQNSRISRD